MGSDFLSPPTKRSAPDPNPFPSKRSRSSNAPPPPPLPVPPGHASFRLICNASRIGGVIGKSGSIIKTLQQSTGAKIRVEDAPAESPDRVILVIADAALTGNILLRNEETVGVSKAQEALLKVFDRILDVAAETEGVNVGDRIMSCRLVADSAQVGSVIGKGGKVVERIKKDTGCKIRVLADNLPLCASDSDEIIEIEGRVSSVKKALVAVSQRLQDCPPVNRTKMMGSKPYEMVQYDALDVLPRDNLTAAPHATLTAVPRETGDHLLLRSSAMSTLSSCSNSNVTRVHSLPVEVNRVSSLERKALQQEVTFRILCSNDRVGGIIGKGGGIVRALQSETGATISIGPSVAECEDRLITITASESHESRYSPAQKATVLVYSRSVETGVEKGLDSGNKGSTVMARLVVPSSQVGCLLGKGGVIVSEMRKATGASIRIIGTDQVPKCVSDNDQVVQITGEFSNVQDALYNATGRLRDNLFGSTQNSTGTRSLSSLRVDTSPYGRLQDVVPLGSQPIAASSHSLSRHTFAQGIGHVALSRNLDHPSSPRHIFPQGIHHVALSRNLDHPSSPRHTFAQAIDHHTLSRNLDRPSSPRHTFAQGIDHYALSRNLDRPSSPRHTLAQGIDHHALSRNLVRPSSPRHTFSRGIDHLALSRNLDRPSSPRHTFVQGIDHLAHSRNLDRPSSPRHTFAQGIDYPPLSRNLGRPSSPRHTFAQGIDHLALSRNLDRPSSPRNTFAQGIDHLALSRNIDRSSSPRHTFAQGIDHHALSRNLDCSSSPGLWTPPTLSGINARGISDASWGLQSRKGGLELVSGSKSAIVTSTTVEITVPDDTINSVYGENGSNLARLRQISGAKVVIHEPRPGTSDRTIVISGTPDETKAAQSLLQAFILSGS